MYVQHLDADLRRPLRGMSCLDLLQRPEEQFEVNMWTLNMDMKLRGYEATQERVCSREKQKLSLFLVTHSIGSYLHFLRFFWGFFFFPE